MEEFRASPAPRPTASELPPAGVRLGASPAASSDDPLGDEAAYPSAWQRELVDESDPAG